MKRVLYILLLPIGIYSQNTISNLTSKNVHFSFESGVKFYAGNLFLNQTKFSREGLFFSLNIFTKKQITKKTSLIPKASLMLSNAFSKKIEIISNISDLKIDNSFTTKIPNILSCNIIGSIALLKTINNSFSHAVSLQFRLYPLFYKKGQLFNTELNSLGGLIATEENGSLPSLEKATNISYSINYLLNSLTSIKLLVFINSDWSIKSFNIGPLYPGLAIKFEKILNLNK